MSRRPVHRRAGAVILGFGGLLVACSAPGTVETRHGFEGLETLLRANRFEPVSPPEERLLPGTVLEAVAPGRRAVVVASVSDVFPALEFPDGPPVDTPSQAAFLNSWSHVGTTSGDLSLSALLGSARPGELEATLAGEGVHTYRLSFGDASIERLTAAALERHRERIPDGARRRIDAGLPVILEALVVESIVLDFSDAGKQSVSIGADLLNRVGLSIGGEWQEHVSGGMARVGRFVIGVQTRTFELQHTRSPDGAAHATLRLPVPLKQRSADELVVENRDLEPNDSAATATVVAPTASIDGKVGFGGDTEDWFVFRAPRDGEWSVSIRNDAARGTKNANLGKVVVFGADGQNQLVARRGPFAPGQSTKRPTVLSVHGGEWYFVRVIPAPQRGHAAPYRLTLAMQ